MFLPFLQEYERAMVKFSLQPSQCERRLRRGKAALVQMLSWHLNLTRILPLMVDVTADKKEPVLHRRSDARHALELESVSKRSRCCSSAAFLRMQAEMNRLK